MRSFHFDTFFPLRLRSVSFLWQRAVPCKQSSMDGPEDPGYDDYTVFAGSSEHDVMCSRIFWNSVTLQPPLESRLVSGDVEQRLRAAREAKPRKNDTQQELDELKTQYFLLEAQRVRDVEQRSVYMQKAKRREEIIALLKKQREDRIKKELVSFGHKPNIHIEEQRLPTHDGETIEDIKTVRQLD
ncbi:cilia- and flagella-associated protein HOATZ isoform X2 [Hyla sarda]|uniref:cilia- and flagella-associated protein HOATZ isoform X2 n=1 Tax=Hyla sarda TaxID=327740 RepID=UPI0024C38857|nr:cilia- and flagella-associated protein HOATZ isoform X2 [Hyla sarda]